jgi:DNA polymerase III delta prime subunit
MVLAGPSFVHNSGPLCSIVEKTVSHSGSRAAKENPHRRASSVNVADLVRVMTIRAGGHFCLHAATVAYGGRGILLMGPSGSGKTTTALALLRDGFELFSDELSVLNANPGSVRIMGFKCEPRIVGRAPRTLASLERTLRSANKPKTGCRLPTDLAPVKETSWLKPSAMFFLRIQPGAKDHTVNPLPREEAFVRVTNQVLDPTNVFRREAQAQAVISLVEQCPAYELVLGSRLASLPREVRTLIGDAC